MHHGRIHKVQGVFTKFQCSAVCCYQFLFYACPGKIFREKLLHKFKTHSRGNYRYLRVFSKNAGILAEWSGSICWITR